MPHVQLGKFKSSCQPFTDITGMGQQIKTMHVLQPMCLVQSQPKIRPGSLPPQPAGWSTVYKIQHVLCNRKITILFSMIDLLLYRMVLCCAD
jgi:hypothetical protein